MFFLVGCFLMVLLFCVSVGVVANQKGLDGPLWTLASLVITPIFAAILLCAAPSDNFKVQERQAKSREKVAKREEAMKQYVGKQAKKAEAAYNKDRVNKLVKDNS